MNAYFKAAGIALAAYAVVYAVQKHMVKLPVVGPYLPGGQ